VVAALIKAVRKLPVALRRSLTWDRGVELSNHAQFTIATDVQVYFCDPSSPWQRGSNQKYERAAAPVLSEGHGSICSQPGSVRYRGSKTKYTTPRNSSLEDTGAYAWCQCFDDPLRPLFHSHRKTRWAFVVPDWHNPYVGDAHTRQWRLALPADRYQSAWARASCPAGLNYSTGWGILRRPLRRPPAFSSGGH